MLSENMKDRVRTILNFSLCIVSLLVVLVAYFESGLKKLNRLRLLENSKICCY